MRNRSVGAEKRRTRYQIPTSMIKCVIMQSHQAEPFSAGMKKTLRNQENCPYSSVKMPSFPRRGSSIFATVAATKESQRPRRSSIIVTTTLQRTKTLGNSETHVSPFAAFSLRFEAHIASYLRKVAVGQEKGKTGKRRPLEESFVPNIVADSREIVTNKKPNVQDGMLCNLPALRGAEVVHESLLGIKLFSRNPGRSTVYNRMLTTEGSAKRGLFTNPVIKKRLSEKVLTDFCGHDNFATEWIGEEELEESPEKVRLSSVYS